MATCCAEAEAKPFTIHPTVAIAPRKTQQSIVSPLNGPRLGASSESSEFVLSRASHHHRSNASSVAQAWNPWKLRLDSRREGSYLSEIHHLHNGENDLCSFPIKVSERYCTLQKDGKQETTSDPFTLHWHLRLWGICGWYIVTVKMTSKKQLWTVSGPGACQTMKPTKVSHECHFLSPFCWWF